jgi:hypothetical protein
MEEASAYGLWSLVIINSLVFIIFAFSFAKPQTKRDWRSFSAFSAFIVALFVEMYGFPLTIYSISGWLVRRYPGLDPFSHDAGHLWNTLLRSKINPHFDPLHIFSNVLIFGDSFFWPLLEGVVRSTADPYACDDGSLRLCSPPAICRLHSHHARLSISVAYDHHPDHIPHSRDNVCEACASRRKGGVG